MRAQTVVAISAIALALARPQAGGSQGLTIDNFTTGKYHVNLRSGDNAGDPDKIQSGLMLGGFRLVNFILGTPSQSNNPYRQDGELSIRLGRFILSDGFKVFPRVEIFYGVDATAPLHSDLSAYDHFRVRFEALDDGLNFNMQVLAGNNPVVAQSGINLVRSGNAFNVDLPFSSFAPNSGPAPDFSDVHYIDLILQAGNDLGSNDLAIHSIRAIKKNS